MAEMAELPLIIDDRETPKFWVNRATMVEPGILEQEREKIFDKCWLYVGHESELQNVHDFRTRRVGGRPVIFTRSSENNINVLVNVCTHRGMILETRKEGNGRNMRCFYHGWSFNTDGKLTSMPQEEDYPDGWKKSERCLPRPPHVDSYRGFWFLCWDKDQSESLFDYLANATDYIDLVADQSDTMMQIAGGSHLYSMHANWKLLAENSADGYHAMTTHNRYIQMISASGADFKKRTGGGKGLGGGAADLGNGHAAVGASDHSKGDRPAGLARAFHSEEAGKDYKERRQHLAEKYGEEWTDRILGGRNVVIFPNLVIVDLGMGCTVRTFYPEEPGYMEITSWELSPPEITDTLSDARKSDFLTFWGPAGLATPDDVEALSRCQKGFASYKIDPWSDLSRGMDKEHPASTDELQMRVFWRKYNELMTGEPVQVESGVYEKVDMIARSGK
jgi:p-cumate 2,3-dioxygenase alpha subunit